MLADNCCWLNYIVLKRLQQILVLVHILHLYLYQHLFLQFIIVSLSLEMTILIYILSLFYKRSCFGFYWGGRIFSQSFVFFDDKFKVILDVWDWIRTIKQMEFIIPSRGRYFKFIVAIHWFNVFLCVTNT